MIDIPCVCKQHQQRNEPRSQRRRRLVLFHSIGHSVRLYSAAVSGRRNGLNPPEPPCTWKSIERPVRSCQMTTGIELKNKTRSTSAPVNAIHSTKAFVSLLLRLLHSGPLTFFTFISSFNQQNFYSAHSTTDAPYNWPISLG